MEIKQFYAPNVCPQTLELYGTQCSLWVCTATLTTPRPWPYDVKKAFVFHKLIPLYSISHEL